MRTRIGILTILLTGTFLHGTTAASAECSTLAQARALNPNSYLAYRVIAGAHCWYAGYPLHRSQAATTPKTAEKVLTSKQEKTAEPTRAGGTAELRSAFGQLAPRPRASPSHDPDDDLTTGTSTVARSGIPGVQAERPDVSARSFDLSAADIQVSMPVLSAVPPVLPAPSEERHLPLLAWFALLTVGLQAIILAILTFYRRRSKTAQNACGAIIPVGA